MSVESVLRFVVAAALMVGGLFVVRAVSSTEKFPYYAAYYSINAVIVLLFARKRPGKPQ